MWKGRQERVSRGLPPGGNVAYGYRRDSKRIAMDTREAGVVRTIFGLAERSESGASIARTLNDEGLARRKRYGPVSREDKGLALIAERGGSRASGEAVPE